MNLKVQYCILADWHVISGNIFSYIHVLKIKNKCTVVKANDIKWKSNRKVIEK